jgi:WXG100 family type VII secretion target
MAKAVVDPEELRRFARDLKRFNDTIESQMTSLRGRLHTLSQTWRDQEQTKFAEEFDQTMTVLKRFTEASSEHIPFLLKKAQHIDNYLQQR